MAGQPTGRQCFGVANRLNALGAMQRGGNRDSPPTLETAAGDPADALTLVLREIREVK